MKKKDTKNAGWFGVRLRDGTVYICNYVKRDESAGIKRIRGFIGEISETGKINLSNTVVDENIGLNVPTFRIPRRPEHIESDLEFLKICKKNKLNGEALDERLEKDLKK
jgi:hypothetical protein